MAVNAEEPGEEKGQEELHKQVLVAFSPSYMDCLGQPLHPAGAS